MRRLGDRAIAVIARDREIGKTATLCERGDRLQRRSFKVVVWLCDAFGTIRATLREIFDESAYDRFLLRTQAERSVASYRAFMRERETVVARRPRCC